MFAVRTLLSAILSLFFCPTFIQFCHIFWWWFVTFLDSQIYMICVAIIVYCVLIIVFVFSKCSSYFLHFFEWIITALNLKDKNFYTFYLHWTCIHLLLEHQKMGGVHSHQSPPLLEADFCHHHFRAFKYTEGKAKTVRCIHFDHLTDQSPETLLLVLQTSPPWHCNVERYPTS